MKKGIKIIGLTSLALVAGVSLIVTSCLKEKPEFSFETAKVAKGSLSSVVTATGTLEAIKTVEVGTQVSGVIRKIYVDFNDYVKAGQLLAELDKTSLNASVEEAHAAVVNAEANLDYQTANYNRVKALYDKQLVASSDYDQAQYNYKTAQAGVISARSQYQRAQVNLGYADIYSPINGIILNRAVNEGQTVAASFNTPTLFTIANDLTQMQVEAAVDETDIGQVVVGQRVSFNVDAYPGLNFEGKIAQVRLQPVVTNNVVTYTVIVTAPNPGNKLMPGMTASITVYVNEASGILSVPDKALRFRPDMKLVKAYYQSLPDNQKPGPAGLGRRQGEKVDGPEVWVKDGQTIRPVPVETGIDNGMSVEVKTGLKEGDEVILSMTETGKAKKSGSQIASSPFMPHRPNRNQNKEKNGKS